MWMFNSNNENYEIQLSGYTEVGHMYVKMVKTN